MINVAALYNTILSNGGHFEWRIANDETIDVSTVIVQDNLVDGKVNPVLFKEASIGNVIASELNFSFYKTVALDTSKPLKLQFRVVDDTQESAWYDKGLFWINEYNTSLYTDKAVVQAFDSLLKGQVTYLESGTWTTTTDWAILSQIALDLGVNIESNTQSLFSSPVNITEAPSIGVGGTSDLQMLSVIAAMKKGNFIIDENNELKLVPLFSELAVGADSVDIGDAVTDFDASDPEIITGVCLWANDNMYYRYPDVTDVAWEALGGRKINVTMPIMASASLAQEIYTALSGKTYYPYTAPQAWVDPKYQLGDGITIKNVSSVICNQTINLTALSSCSLSAEGQQQASSSYPIPSPIERKISENEIRTQASIQVLSDSIESTVQTMDGMQTQITQNSQGIQAVTNRLDGQESYMRWDGAESTLHIGASDAPTEAQISPDGFKVVQDGEDILTAEGRKVKTKHFEAEKDLSVGRYQWIDSGNFTLVYTGA